MTVMEHAIEQAADVLGAHPEAFNVTDYTDERTTMITAPVEDIARALADAGLLAPAPLTEEWATRFENGHLRPGKDRDYDLWFKGDPPKGVNVRRYVTAWLPVDRAEGDGRAEP